VGGGGGGGGEVHHNISRLKKGGVEKVLKEKFGDNHDGGVTITIGPSLVRAKNKRKLR